MNISEMRTDDCTGCFRNEDGWLLDVSEMRMDDCGACVINDDG